MSSWSTVPSKALKLPTSFTVSIPEEQLSDIYKLLELQRSLLRECEKHMNSFPHFKIPVEDGISNTTFELHFVALFSSRADAIPILLLHGWPGSFLEFLPILLLAKSQYTPETLPYHLIIPSLPGYAFSSPPPLDRDFRIEDIARVMNHLMLDLGFGTCEAVHHRLLLS
ncbi:alpha/beta-hydrolase [Acephala macrosclerotiorum]|nr:alpha/beta-hydrolase [Acephala macrosclerotiorum]